LKINTTIQWILPIVLLITGLSGKNLYAKNKIVHSPKQNCDTSAFITDPDPQGLNVRAGPGKNHSIMVKIPKNKATTVDLGGATGQWVFIKYAGLESGIDVFQGPGWVYGPMLGVLSMGTPHLTQSPSPQSQKLLQLEDRVPLTVLSCQGKNLKVKKGRVSGWLRHGEYCSNPVNTCN